MNIALIGATGFVGPHILQEALNRGHRINAVVRNPAKIKITDDNLKILTGDVLNEKILVNLLKGNEAVLSAYNAGWKNPNLYNEYTQGVNSILRATKEAGVKRLITVGGAGSLEIEPGKQFVDTPEFPAEWKEGALAARDFLNVLKKENGLDWTFLCPSIMLKPGKRTGKFRVGKDNPLFDENGNSEISVEDLAVAMIDELEKPQFIGQRFTVGY